MAFAGLLAAGCAAADEPPSFEPHSRTTPAVLSLAGLDGAGVRIPEPTGRVVLLHFFATWCEPCRPELASLDALAKAAAPDGPVVIGVSVAEPGARVQRFLASAPVTFPILLDGDRAASRAWDAYSLPTTVAIGRDGRTRLVLRGAADWQRPDIATALAALDHPPNTAQIKGEQAK